MSIFTPRKYVNKTQPAFFRDWNNQDAGTGKPAPSEGDPWSQRGGVATRVPIRSQFDMPGAGAPYKGHKVATKKTGK